jgi:hypothetical protein
MAENIYGKGTRVWFEDKDQAWISGEVVSVSRAAGDAIKLVFIDDRGKVSPEKKHQLNTVAKPSNRKLSLIRQ